MSDQGYEEMAKRHWEQMLRIEMELGISPASQAAATVDLYRAQRDEWQRRAEAAEQQLMVYRVLMTGAMAAAASEFGRLDDIENYSNEYFELLFDAALHSGAFSEAGCGSGGILMVAEQLHVLLPQSEK